MKHDSYICPPHCEDCECEDPEDEACNPYWIPGFCPTDGEGPLCLSTGMAIAELERTVLAAYGEELLCAFCEGPCFCADVGRVCERCGVIAPDIIIVAGVEVEL